MACCVPLSWPAISDKLIVCKGIVMYESVRILANSEELSTALLRVIGYSIVEEITVKLGVRSMFILFESGIGNLSTVRSYCPT